MASPNIYLRLDDEAYEALQSQSREGEAIAKTAQRLLTLALVGREPELLSGGRPFGAKKKETLPTLEERVKALEDYILGDGR